MSPDELIKQFRNLHKKHVSLLKSGKFISAHEVLNEIHELSFKIEEEERTRIGVAYFCGRVFYVRGKLINGYIGSEFVSNSDKYPLNDEQLKKNNERSMCGPYYSQADIAPIIEVYKQALQAEKSTFWPF